MTYQVFSSPFFFVPKPPRGVSQANAPFPSCNWEANFKIMHFGFKIKGLVSPQIKSRSLEDHRAAAGVLIPGMDCLEVAAAAPDKHLCQLPLADQIHGGIRGGWRRAVRRQRRWTSAMRMPPSTGRRRRSRTTLEMKRPSGSAAQRT